MVKSPQGRKKKTASKIEQLKKKKSAYYTLLLKAVKSKYSIGFSKSGFSFPSTSTMDSIKFHTFKTPVPLITHYYTNMFIFFMIQHYMQIKQSRLVCSTRVQLS